MVAAAKHGATFQYVALDEWLKRPSVRIVKALRWFDWVDIHALFDALELPTFDGGKNDVRNTYAVNLHRLVVRGFVEQDASSWPYHYRLKSRFRISRRKRRHLRLSRSRVQ